MGHDLICILCGRSWEIGEQHWQHSSWRKRATGLSPKKYRYAFREVDIEAMDGKELVFVEVRTREGRVISARPKSRYPPINFGD